MPINKPKYLLVLVDTFGHIESTLEITYPLSVVESFSFPSIGPKYFQRTNDIRIIARDLNLDLFNLTIKGTPVYYVIINFTFIHPGFIDMELSVSDSNTGDYYFKHNLEIFVQIPKDNCFPRIQETQWLVVDYSNEPFQTHLLVLLLFLNSHYPKHPIQIRNDEQHTFSWIIHRNCSTESVLQYKWSVTNYLDTETLMFFNETGSELIVFPFSLPFNDPSAIFSRMYTIKMEVIEIYGQTRGNAFSRVIIII